MLLFASCTASLDVLYIDTGRTFRYIADVNLSRKAIDDASCFDAVIAAMLLFDRPESCAA